jgi:hypothetical protein
MCNCKSNGIQGYNRKTGVLNGSILDLVSDSNFVNEAFPLDEKTKTRSLQTKIVIDLPSTLMLCGAIGLVIILTKQFK